MVRLDPSRGSTLTLILAQPPDRSGGVGGWQATQRTGRAPGKWWLEQPDSAISLECILDLDAIAGPSIERRLDVLYAMGRKGKADAPPIIRLLGDVDPEDRRTRWVLQDIAKGGRLFTPNGLLRQQRVTLQLEGYDEIPTIKPVQIKRTRNQQGRRRRRQVTTHKNDTLRAIAVRELGASSAWQDIASWNERFKGVDPDAPLRAGIKVTLR
jgi:phage protein U